MKTAAIIPALNEINNIASVAIAAGQYVDKVIVVDDGSAKPLKQFLPLDDKIICLRHRINLGKGAAMTTGVQWAISNKFDAVIFIDADGQHHPDEIASIFSPIMNNDADVVFGVRSVHQQMPLIAKFGKVLLTTLVKVLFGIKVSDILSGYRAFRLSVYNKLAWESARYAVETEMIVNAGKNHLRCKEIPISTIYNDKYRGMTILDGIRIIFNILVWRLR
ncbi:MAG: glycosyltransferase family 2 protein [Patescibacteria group bacterium]|jgi:glycosyltransferase involved in cell wall biosynthesis